MLEWLFHKKEERIQGERVDLVVDKKVAASSENRYVPSVYYRIYLHGSAHEVGTCDLRVGMNRELYFAGNIGYNIRPSERGHSYAYEACRVMFEVAAREYGMNTLIITCSPDNMPSKHTLEKLNGKFLETAEVPSDHWLYKRGETIKNIYEYQIA